MTKDEFCQQAIAMTDVLYRIAWSQLPQTGRTRCRRRSAVHGKSVIVNYNIVDQEIYRNSFVPKNLCFLDENGEEVLQGTYPLSSRVDKSYFDMVDDPFYITNLNFEEIPMQITLGEYEGDWEDGWTNGKTYTFHLE